MDIPQKNGFRIDERNEQDSVFQLPTYQVINLPNAHGSPETTIAVIIAPMPLASAPDLIAIVREFLERDILQDSNLSDDKRFNLRVAVNVLAAAERELRLGPQADAAEADRLAPLVGSEGSLEEKNRELARAIRGGSIVANDPQLLDHLRRTMMDALRINNPKWLEG